jgi:NIMA (never in mitosis gene a)-related kinase
MLQKDPARRPSINAILKMPIIEKRIGQFLEDRDFRDEFSHTLLHNQDVFKAFAKKREDDDKSKKQQEELRKKQAAAEEEKQRIKEEEETRKRLEALNVNPYRPPQSYYNQYQEYHSTLNFHQMRHQRTNSFLNLLVSTHKLV